MNQGFTTILYPVRDITKAKKLYNAAVRRPADHG